MHRSNQSVSLVNGKYSNLNALSISSPTLEIELENSCCVSNVSKSFFSKAKSCFKSNS
jgi:hypothetical protein